MNDLQEKLAQAEAAYHQLMMGQQVVMIRDSNGEQIQYGNANAGRLAQYIASLKMQLGMSPSIGPMRTWMGP